MAKFKILRADSSNNETVDFDEGESIESARFKGSFFFDLFQL